MNAHKCDRCGRLYETETRNEFTTVDGQVQDELGKGQYRKHPFQSFGLVLSKLDLCLDCIVSFKRWWSTPDP